MFAGKRTRLFTPTAAVRVRLISTATSIAKIIAYTLAPHANVTLLAETASLAFVRAVILFIGAHLVTLSATCLVLLIGIAVGFALPIGHTLSTNPDESLLAETTLLAAIV